MKNLRKERSIYTFHGGLIPNGSVQHFGFCPKFHFVTDHKSGFQLASTVSHHLVWYLANGERHPSMFLLSHSELENTSLYSTFTLAKTEV